MVAAGRRTRGPFLGPHPFLGQKNVILCATHSRHFVCDLRHANSFKRISISIINCQISFRTLRSSVFLCFLLNFTIGKWIEINGHKPSVVPHVRQNSTNHNLTIVRTASQAQSHQRTALIHWSFLFTHWDCRGEVLPFSSHGKCSK